MDIEEKCQYTQYFYNSVIEFIYFIIIYTESCGFSFLSTVCKYIKFFKVEVSELVSSFGGNTLEEKLCRMLKLFDCFILNDDKIKINRRISIKNSLLEYLILIKSVDLVLKGITSVEKICRSLNFSVIIFVEKKYLMNLFKKSSYFSVENDIVSIHHVHGILAFDHHSSSSVINYFQNILQDIKMLSYDEIVCHSKFVSCGVHSILTVFCILYCSKQFHCKKGCISLRKVFKKYPNLKPLDMELLAQDMLSASPTIGEIIHHKYGSKIQKWIGEISALDDWSGCIYCVVDLTNGCQGVFRVYFTKTSLKEISEISSLKDYLNVRDKVQFDAEYINSETPDRCWKAIKIKPLNTKLVYDECLLEKLLSNSEIQKENCSNNCFGGGSLNYYKYSSIIALDTKSYNESLYSVASQKLDKYVLASKDISKKCISNLCILDYMFMFGYVFMLMEDKGMAISDQGNKLYNIFFMKDSVYTNDKSKTYPLRGQKVLLFVPFIEKVESVSVAILVYTLTENESKEIQEMCITPKDFVINTFMPNICEETGIKFKESCCSIINSFLAYQPKNFVINEQNKIELHEICDSVKKNFRVMQNQNLMQFLIYLCKADSDCKSTRDKVIHMLVKLSKNLFPEYSSQNKSRIKSRKKIKKTGKRPFESCDKKNNSFPDFDIKVSSVKITEEKCKPNVNNTDNSLDVHFSSCSSLSSYKSCSSMNSSDTLYSCISKEDTKSCDSLSGVADDISSEFPDKKQHSSHLRIQNGDSISVIRNFCDKSESKSEMKPCKNKCNKICRSKYFCLQSFPVLKPIFRKKRRFHTLCQTKCMCQNCYKSSVTTMANISMISESFLFFNVNVYDYKVVLPLPRRILPKNLEEKFKLNSCSEITVIPNTLANLSHILAINLT